MLKRLTHVLIFLAWSIAALLVLMAMRQSRADLILAASLVLGVVLLCRGRIVIASHED